MQNNAKRIGISGGTFDPIHYGHLITSEDIRDKFNLDRILFIPSGNPPHKNNMKIAAAEHRLNMVRNAVEGNPYFEVSSIEVERKGYTYTVDTLSQLKKSLNEEAEVFFITGADVLWDLLTWKDYNKVFELCEFIVALRPGYGKDKLMERIEFMKTEYSARIHEVNTPLIGISSTDIRERVRSGRSIKYLVPEKVEAYIMENSLYKGD